MMGFRHFLPNSLKLSVFHKQNISAVPQWQLSTLQRAYDVNRVSFQALSKDELRVRDLREKLPAVP